MIKKNALKSNLVILGAGHLISPLLERLGENYSLTATTSSAERREEFQKFSLQHVILKLPLKEKVPSFLSQTDYLIISIPPGLPQGGPSPLLALAPLLKENRLKHTIFISSLSVYGKQGLCDEETTPVPESENGKLLLKVEDELRKILKEHLTIIRPGGLIAEDRHPGRYLAGKIIADPHEKIHLIHEEDVRQVMTEVLQRPQSAPAILNLSVPTMQTKIEYYERYCLKNDLPAPVAKSHASKEMKRIIETKELMSFIPHFSYSPLP